MSAFKPLLTGICAAVVLASAVDAATFSETTLGDFSNIQTSPTSLGELSLGENFIDGLVDFTFGGDADIVTFSLAPGQQVTSIELLGFGGSSSSRHFIGLAQDTIAPATSADYITARLVPDSFTDPIDLLAPAGSGQQELGTQGSINPSDPLNFTLFFNETVAGTYAYSARITTAVPEPSSLAVLVPAAAFGFYRRRR
ncbi:MAG: PEP-CTERM sorting domain-containing protein [Planctomycetota bacterium]